MERVLARLGSEPLVDAMTFRQIAFWGGLGYVANGWYLRRGAADFHRLFRWGPGFGYAPHRPPTVVDDTGRDLRAGRWLDADATVAVGVRLYHYSLLLPKQVIEKCDYYAHADWARLSEAIEWANDAYLALHRPFRVHNAYAYPSWLERTTGRAADDLSPATPSGKPVSCLDTVRDPPDSGPSCTPRADGTLVIRVQFDDQIMRAQPRGGVSRYFVELVREFRDDAGLGVAVDVDWRSSRNEHAVAAGLGLPAGRSRRRLPSLPWRRIDLIHPTWHHPDRRPPITGPPMVVTVVDMIPELLPELFPSGNPHFAKEAYVRQASAILCISESTRRDLLQVYGPLDADVEVVHLAAGSGFAPGQTYPRPLGADYVLFVGSRGSYKDFGVAAEAFAAMRGELPGLELVAVGGGELTEDERANLRRLSIDGSVRRIDATDAELPGLYCGARAFVFPSRYEGFGLPTLEAMACGAPVILADSSSHPEVGGDAALYFAPGDAAALGAQLLRVLTDSELRRRLVALGLERSGGFTWRQTAIRTRDVYARVAPRG